MSEMQELQHWGIKGQKWGVRRFQNEDGTLTEAGKRRYYYQNPDGSLTDVGKKDYMKAARTGKLNLSKLSDADLQMINTRFTREAQFKKNIQDYEDSLFSNKLKKAIIERIKNGGNGGGGGGKKGGGSSIGNLLATPIKKAFEDAFKFDPGKDDGGDNRSKDDIWYDNYVSSGRFVAKNSGKKTVADFVTDSRISTGKKFLRQADNRTSSDSGFKTWNTSGDRGSADILTSRHAKHTPSVWNAINNTSVSRREKRRREKERQKERNRQRWEQQQRLNHGLTMYVISRNTSDELMHFGIKGQKWGVRRFENFDGTLTAAGRERYRDANGSSNERHPDLNYRDSNAVGAYVRDTVQKKYISAARNEAVWKKHGLGQDTVSEFVKQPKYGDMVKHIESATKESLDAAIKAGNDATKSKENMRNPGPLWENMCRKNVAYWDKFQEVADEYISKHYSNTDQEIARGVVYWWFIDW